MRRIYCWAKIFLPVLFSVSFAVGQTVGPDPGLYYGPGINADALNNTRVGGPESTSAGWRFLCTHSGSLVSFKHYVIWSTARPGYNGGNGGTLQYELRTDDGTASHLPGNTILSTVTLDNPMAGSHFPVLNWPTAVSLTAGTIYHITCKNINADPTNNYVSLDNLFTYSGTHPVNPTTIDNNWATLVRFGTGAWSARSGETPILELQYSDGFRSGQGQMEIWVGNPKTIGGASAVRERFTVSGGNRTVSQASVRMRKVSGTDAVTMTLEQSDGTAIEAVTVPNSAVSTSYAWVNFPLSTPRTLTNGQTYNLKLSAPSGTAYDAYPLSDGSVSYGFDKRTTFSDGLAQFTTGSSWTGWDQWGATNRQDGDLQFYFKLNQSTSPPPPPSLNVAPNSLPDFGSINVGSSSAAMSYTVSGINLTGNVTVTAPVNFQVSLTSGSGFASSISIAPLGGTVGSTTVYVRFSPSTTGTKSGSITNAASGVNTQNVSVSGTGQAPPPATASLSVSAGALTNFGTVTVGSSSAGMSYTVAGSNLAGNIVITAPSDFQVSLSSGSGYGSTVSLVPSGGAVPSTTVYARFTPSTAGAKSGYITNASTGAVTRNVSVSGTGGDVQAILTQEAYYGAGVNSDGLSSIRIGGTGNIGMSWRFRCEYRGTLTSFMHYLTWTSSGSSYNAGTGGKLLYKLRTDDGTSNHGPSNTVLATVTVDNPMLGSHFPMLAWSSPVALDSGSIYHITCENIDADPVNNFVSINNLWAKVGSGAASLSQDGAEWTVMQFADGAWTSHASETPILELQYADGFTTGQGYMEVWIGNPKTIGGANGVRELFTVTGGDRTVSQTSIWMRRVSGTGRLTVTLENADGTVIQKKRVFSRDVSTSYAWVTSTFDKPQLLVKGQTYRLSLSAPSGTVYEAYPLRDGSINYGFSNATVFADGYAQFTAGGSWVGWDQWGATDRRDADLQFYFSSGATLSSPSIISPTPSAKIAPDSVVLRWSEAEGSTSYQVQVAVDSEFATSILDTVVADTVLIPRSRWTPSRYFACVRALGNGVASSYSEATSFQVGESQTMVDAPPGTITEFKLLPNYPNPFNPTTVITYAIGGVRGEGPGPSVTRLAVYDVLGREVAVLVNERKPAGTYQVSFDGAGFSSGVYIYRLTEGAKVQARRMLLIK